MNDAKKLTVAVIGLGFGASFAHIFAAHPAVERVVLVDKSEARMDAYLKRKSRVWERAKVDLYPSFDAVLSDASIDAVAVFTGIPSHAKLVIDTLNAGKHCACAVPMATLLEDLQAIVDTARRSGKNYMMMETDVYGGMAFKAREMLANGEFGKIQHMRGVHYQPMDDGWWNTEITSYWQGLPPMWYATHAIAPLYDIAGSRGAWTIVMGAAALSLLLNLVLVRVDRRDYPKLYAAEKAD